MTYQPFGAVEGMALGNGLAAANDRGTDGRLRRRRLTNVSSSAMPVGTKLSDLSYVYDPDGNVTSIDDKVMPERSAIYGYDTVGRLNMMVAEGSATPANYSYTSGTNRLASVTIPEGTRSIAYDTRGNPLGETRPAGQAVTLAYDGHGRLTSYARSGEASLTHSYNGLDDRVATSTTAAGSSSADTRRFVYAPDGRVLGEYGSSASDPGSWSGASVRAEFIWMAPEVGANDNSLFGGDDGAIGSEGGGYMPLAVAANDNISGPQLLWVHGNHMGVPAVFTNASGAQVAVPASYSLPGFPGQSQTFSDLYYNRHRDYDPSTGRYIQADPIGLAGGASPYSYAMNSPLRYTDPHGLFVDTIADVGFVLYDLYRLGKDNVFGDNCPETLSANATALGADLAALFVPGITGLGTASRVAKVHKNSLNYIGDTHFYAIRGADGSLHKVGQSAQGVRARDGMSRRAERQARALQRKTNDFYNSEIRKNFRNKADALAYERRFIETYRRLYGKRPPGNLHGR